MRLKAVSLCASFIVRLAAQAHAADTVAGQSADDAATRVLAQARTAMGGAEWHTDRFLHLTLKRQLGDVSAPEEIWIDTLGARAALTRTLDRGVYRWGIDGNLAWIQETDGRAAPADPQARQGLVSEAFWRSFGWLVSPLGKVTIDGTRSEARNGHHYDVVQLTPAGGRQLSIWFDGTTHLPARIAVALPGHEETIRLSDWRPFHEIQVPWRLDIDHAYGGAPGDQQSHESLTDIARINTEPGQFQMPAATIDYTFPRDSISVETPIKLVNSHIFLQGRIGKSRMALRFDTASRSIIDAKFAQANGLDIGQPTIRPPELSVGGVVFRRLSLDVRDLGTIAGDEGVPVDGLLGVDILAHLVAEIDYEGRRLVWVKPESFVAPPSATVLPLTMSGSAFGIDARLDGIAMNLTLDSASDAGLIIDPAFVTDHDAAARWHLSPGLLDIAGSSIAARIGRAGSIELGVLGIAQPSVIVPSTPGGPNEGVIGGAILHHFDVILDYPHGRLLLQENGVPDGPEPVNHAGMTLIGVDTKLTVAGIVPDGPAARAGLRVGDVITAVDGTPIGAASLPATRSMLNGMPGTGITFATARHGAEKSVRIILSDPLDLQRTGD